jgi:hypothetical protein
MRAIDVVFGLDEVAAQAGGDQAAFQAFEMLDAGFLAEWIVSLSGLRYGAKIDRDCFCVSRHDT